MHRWRELRFSIFATVGVSVFRCDRCLRLFPARAVHDCESFPAMSPGARGPRTARNLS